MTGKKENLGGEGLVILYFQLISVTYKKYSTFEKVTGFSKTFYTYIWNLTQKHVFLRKDAILLFLQPAERKIC